MSTNSSTSGFIEPLPQVPVLGAVKGLTLVQFLQSLFVGLSELPPPMVRPDWQSEPPKSPDLSTNWMAFGIKSVTPDFNAFIGFDQNQNPFLQRNELLCVGCSFYGPAAYDNVSLVRDGIQLGQNNAALLKANMGFAYDTEAQHIPDFVNERFIDRYVTEFYFRRQIIRTYPILNFVSANGTIYSQTAVQENYTENWQTATGS